MKEEDFWEMIAGAYSVDRFAALQLFRSFCKLSKIPTGQALAPGDSFGHLEKILKSKLPYFDPNQQSYGEFTISALRSQRPALPVIERLEVNPAEVKALAAEIKRLSNLWNEASEVTAPVVPLINALATGKSELVQQLHTERIFLTYCCFQNPSAEGSPKRTPYLPDLLLDARLDKMQALRRYSSFALVVTQEFADWITREVWPDTDAGMAQLAERWSRYSASDEFWERVRNRTLETEASVAELKTSEQIWSHFNAKFEDMHRRISEWTITGDVPFVLVLDEAAEIALCSDRVNHYMVLLQALQAIPFRRELTHGLKPLVLTIGRPMQAKLLVPPADQLDEWGFLRLKPLLPSRAFSGLRGEAGGGWRRLISSLSSPEESSRVAAMELLCLLITGFSCHEFSQLKEIPSRVALDLLRVLVPMPQRSLDPEEVGDLKLLESYSYDQGKVRLSFAEAFDPEAAEFVRLLSDLNSRLNDALRVAVAEIQDAGHRGERECALLTVFTGWKCREVRSLDLSPIKADAFLRELLDSSSGDLEKAIKELQSKLPRHVSVADITEIVEKCCLQCDITFDALIACFLSRMDGEYPEKATLYDDKSVPVALVSIAATTPGDRPTGDLINSLFANQHRLSREQVERVNDVLAAEGDERSLGARIHKLAVEFVVAANVTYVHAVAPKASANLQRALSALGNKSNIALEKLGNALLSQKRIPEICETLKSWNLFCGQYVQTSEDRTLKLNVDFFQNKAAVFCRPYQKDFDAEIPMRRVKPGVRTGTNIELEYSGFEFQFKNHKTPPSLQTFRNWYNDIVPINLIAETENNPPRVLIYMSPPRPKSVSGKNQERRSSAEIVLPYSIEKRGNAFCIFIR